VIVLSYDELVELTGRRRRDAQLIALKYMGIEHRVRPDGSLAVLRSHVSHIFGAPVDKAALQPTRKEPNWKAI
jgi:hypothetical protein